MVLPFVVIVHYASVSQSGRGKDRISFSCRFKSGQEHQIIHANITKSPHCIDFVVTTRCIFKNSLLKKHKREMVKNKLRF